MCETICKQIKPPKFSSFQQTFIKPYYVLIMGPGPGDPEKTSLALSSRKPQMSSKALGS